MIIYIIIEMTGYVPDVIDVPRWAYRDKGFAENLVAVLDKIGNGPKDINKMKKYQEVLGDERSSQIEHVGNSWILREVELMDA